jgi:hypothetical protein
MSMASYLEKLASRLTGEVEVGFMADAKYEDGTNIAAVAFWNEYGAKINVPAHTITNYRKIDKQGNFLRKGRFVKRKQSNFSSDHMVPAHTITIPPRPFFRNAIAEAKKSLTEKLGKKLAKDSDADALSVMGELMVNEIQVSILDGNYTPNAASTIRNKGFDKPLVGKFPEMYKAATFNKVEA